MAAITSSMSPGYLGVNPYLEKNSQEKWVYLEEQAGAPQDKTEERVSESPQPQPQKSPQAEKAPEKTSEDVQKDIETRAQIAELKRIEAEVIAHESAHIAVGGQFAGGVSYTKTQGPDGKNYITGGEVPISVPASDDPEETIRNMEQVMAAALAPARPSSQDLSVAASASSQLAAARAEAASNPENAQESQPNLKEKEAVKSYSQNQSLKGLWTFGKGYETGTENDKKEPEFSLAA